MPKIETKKLLVEGAEELRVIPQLMAANGVTWNRGEEPLNIINCDGVENLLTGLPPYKHTSYGQKSYRA